MRENVFQSAVVKTVQARYPDAIVTANNGNYMQGFPDVTIFHESTWAMLECKRSAHEPRQPNQEYYVCLFNTMSFARFVYPENLDQVLEELYAYLDGAEARLSGRE